MIERENLFDCYFDVSAGKKEKKKFRAEIKAKNERKVSILILLKAAENENVKGLVLFFLTYFTKENR